MVTADLGQCEWFVWDLRRSSLVERGRLDQYVAEYLAKHPNAEPAQLAAHLVEHGVLSQFQADSLLAGKNQGLVLGPYVVHDTLGAGSMGTVYRAMSKTNGKTFAVKVLPRRSMWNIRLARRKVREFEQITHAAVVPFVDVGTAGSMHFLAWPYVEGEPLHKVVERQGRLPHAEAARYAMLAAEGLDASHQIGIIHGLFKPSNVLITGDKEVRILDFGVGALLAETENESVVDTMSTANTMASGLDCASPEGIMDPTQMTVLSDQYSLGCVLYFCMTGNMPFTGTNAVEKMMAHQTKEPPPIHEAAPDVPEDLVDVVKRLMQKTPADRYPAMADVVAALRPFAGAASDSARLRMAARAVRPKSAPPATMRPPSNGHPEPSKPPSGTRLGGDSRPPAASRPLPDRRAMDVPEPRPFQNANFGGPAPTIPARTPTLPSRGYLAAQEDESESSTSNLTSFLIAAAALLAACVAGWVLAGSF